VAGWKFDDIALASWFDGKLPAGDAAGAEEPCRVAGAAPRPKVAIEHRHPTTEAPAVDRRCRPAIVVALMLAEAVATLASVAVFRVSDRRAKDRGLLDRTTGS
jgi:hypothetical protein